MNASGGRMLPGRAGVNSATGLTMVELPVVLTGIGILSSSLLPALARAKSQARSVDCLGHLHRPSAYLHLADSTSRGRDVPNTDGAHAYRVSATNPASFYRLAR